MSGMAREYGQFCGLARALELVGGRWTLLIVRDLFAGPRRFTELQEGLPGIATNMLSSRLRELEEEGIVERRLLARPSNSVVYALTPFGLALEEPLVALGLWGLGALGPPKETDCFNASSFALALRGAFRPEVAQNRDLRFEIRLGEFRLHLVIERGRLFFPTEASETPDVVLQTTPDALAELLAGELDLKSAIAAGRLELEGRRRAAPLFFEIFSLSSHLQVAP
ncbi:MAG: winged helix-turn-helix transcriptional regulator [Actinomycetota bacterium]